MKHHKSFQGTRNFNAWSTISYIRGVPSLYYKAKALKKSNNLENASKQFLEFCKERNRTKTIDGVILNKTNIAICMKGIRID